jgi:predicted transcriptional regulator
MKTVTIGVASRAEVTERAKAAFRGQKQGARISFVSPELMFRTLTSNRWDILRRMAGAGPMGVRELARRLDRDVKGVHRDVHALLNAGVIDRDDDGRIVFPFDAIRVEFVVNAFDAA